MTDSLGDALPKEQARVRGVLKTYYEIGPAGKLGAFLIEQALARADQAAIGGDIVEMVRAYQELKEIGE